MLKIYIFKIFITIIILKNWEIFNFNIIITFLYRFIDKKIYIKQLKDFNIKGKKNFIYKFKRFLYGLK